MHKAEAKARDEYREFNKMLSISLCWMLLALISNATRSCPFIHLSLSALLLPPS